MSLEFVKRNCIGKYFDVFLTRFSIGIKEALQYKAQFYTGTISHLTFNLVMIFSTIVVLNNFSFIDFTIFEIIFMFLHSQVLVMSFGLFLWYKKFSNTIKLGDLNLYLTKPILTNFFCTITYFPYYALFYCFFDLILFLFFGLYFNFLNPSYILTFLISLIGIGILVFEFRVLDSLAFFIKENYLILKFFRRFDGLYHQFPIILFENSLFFFGLIIGFSLYGVLPISFYFGKVSLDLIYLSYILGGLFLIFLIFLEKIIWHYGLKKYEAFG